MGDTLIPKMESLYVQRRIWLQPSNATAKTSVNFKWREVAREFASYREVVNEVGRIGCYQGDYEGGS